MMHRTLLSIFALFLLLNADTGARHIHTQPVYMSFDDFKEQALEPKSEIWVVDFWASWCGPCIQSMPRMKKVQAEYEGAGKPVRFISVSWDQHERNWKEAINGLAMNWTHVIVPDARHGHPFIDRHFKHRGIPCLFVIAHTGKVKKFGNDPYGLEMALDKAIEKMEKD